MTVVFTAMNFWIPQNVGNFATKLSVTVSFHNGINRILLCGSTSYVETNINMKIINTLFHFIPQIGVLMSLRVYSPLWRGRTPGRVVE
jgi:hypothetical protein